MLSSCYSRQLQDQPRRCAARPGTAAKGVSRMGAQRAWASGTLQVGFSNAAFPALTQERLCDTHADTVKCSRHLKPLGYLLLDTTWQKSESQNWKSWFSYVLCLATKKPELTIFERNHQWQRPVTAVPLVERQKGHSSVQGPRVGTPAMRVLSSEKK